MSEEDPLIGTLVADRYRVQSRLGEGGMGVVYLAVHEALRKPVALKLLATSGRIDREAVARFEREAIAAANLKHPNIAEATDFGRLPDGALYLVMEYVEGTTLRRLLREQGKLTPERGLGILQQVASALATAHARDVVHRDLKPENVIVSSMPGATGAAADHVKVIDFGIAKIRNATFGGGATGLTKAGTVFGTPEYMAPEQVMGQAVDAKADQYALGVLAFELFTGKAPFKADDIGQLMMMHVGAPVPSTRDRTPTIPHEADAVISRMLGKMPDDRFASVGEAMQALAAAFAGGGPASVAGPTSNPTVKLGRGAQESFASLPDAQASMRGTMPSAMTMSLGPVQASTPSVGVISVQQAPAPPPSSPGGATAAMTPRALAAMGALSSTGSHGPGSLASTGSHGPASGAAFAGAYAPGSMPGGGAQATVSLASLPSVQAQSGGFNATASGSFSATASGNYAAATTSGTHAAPPIPVTLAKKTGAKSDSRKTLFIAIGAGAGVLLLVLILVLVLRSGGPPSLSSDVMAALADWKGGKVDAAGAVIRNAVTADPKLAENEQLAQGLAAQVGNEGARRALAGLLATTALGRSTAMASALAAMAVKDEATARNGALELVRDRQDLLTAEQGARVRLRDAEDCEDFEAARSEEAKVITPATQRDLERLGLGECKRMVRVTEVCGCNGAGGGPGKGGPPGGGLGPGPGKGKGKKDKGRPHDDD